MLRCVLFDRGETLNQKNGPGPTNKNSTKRGRNFMVLRYYDEEESVRRSLHPIKGSSENRGSVNKKRILEFGSTVRLVTQHCSKASLKSFLQKT